MEIKESIIDRETLDLDQYEISDQADPKNRDPRTLYELVEHLKNNPEVEIEARFLGYSTDGKRGYRKFKNRESFLGYVAKADDQGAKLRESFDCWGGDNSQITDLVGDDFVPLLGGPFFKQMYLRDMLKSFQLAFYAYHHDPFARATVHIIRDFTLGRGYRVDCDNDQALAVWRAFEKVNNLQKLMSDLAVELSIYGEDMIWWLPDGDVKFVYQPSPGDPPSPKGFIPRVKLRDPSGIWEIITQPEDLTPIAYQEIFPTQYQMFTQPGIAMSKFIMQQIPAEQVIHVKINCVSNEKRGRSDFYPALGYMKRLRDSVNYSIIAMQKASAWAMDTTIEGSQADLEAYVTDQQSQGTIAPAGSEFVHTKAISRQYLSNQAARGGDNKAFEWALSMACMAVGIPVGYYGVHLSGGGTRASALVATEPVAKKMEERQQVYQTVLVQMWDKLMDHFGIQGAEPQITFPEIIVQDRSAKIKDVKIAEDSGYISRARAATIVAKELNINEYEYEIEKDEIEQEQIQPILPNLISPLTAAPQTPTTAPGDSGNRPSAVTSADRRAIAQKDSVL